ncbi:hypothetical protein XELAEV_18004110mg [Xenopus laevis]|uniref:Uncharacterized protein n=1 Tax=Xenopus laevis TaxID=8355 RepID=A0A974H064_XENLA|nr:hypothetical protein XELAEV_18004110mg [Xenopus laevis]
MYIPKDNPYPCMNTTCDHSASLRLRPPAQGDIHITKHPMHHLLFAEMKSSSALNRS